MKAFVFEYLGKVSNNYHEEGGLFIVAKDRDRAKEIVSETEDVEVTDEEWNRVIEFHLDPAYPCEEIIISFPDAGCC